MGITSKVFNLLPASLYLIHRHFSPRFLHRAYITFSHTNSRQISHYTLNSSSRQLHTQSSSSNAESSVKTAFSQMRSAFVSGVLKMLEGYNGNYSESSLGKEDEELLVSEEEAGDDFLKTVDACMKIARDRPDALGFLSRKDLEVIVNYGSPSLFKNGTTSSHRLKLFLSGEKREVMESERAQTADIMRYVLSYAYDSLSNSERLNQNDAELFHTAFRNVVTQLVNMSGIYVSSEQASRSPMANIEMKPGDWLCGNCDHFNHGRNISCLRCDCKRPGEPSTASMLDQILGGIKPENYSIKQNKATIDEKTERNANRTPQFNHYAEMNNSKPYEDIPELMPLKRGSVNTRKTSKSSTDNSRQGIDKSVPNNVLLQNASKEVCVAIENNLVESNKGNLAFEDDANESNFVPFVHSPPNYLAKKDKEMGSATIPTNENIASENISNENSGSGNIQSTPRTAKSLERSGVSDPDALDMSEEAKAGRWFKRAAQIKSISELSDIPDEDFPQVMPMRKGLNRFVVTKRKTPPEGRRITSLQYRRSLQLVSSEPEKEQV